MREFCKFNDIYERINVLEESVSKNFPGLKAPWGKAAKEARSIGASAPTREAKSIVLNIIVGLMSKRVGRELTTQEERDLLRFRNIPSQTPLVEFLKNQEVDGHTYASVINDASPADIEEAAAGTGIADPVEFQVGQRSEQRKEAYKRRAEDRAEAKAEAEAMADAAEEGGDEELANSLDEVGDYIVKFAKSITEVEGAPLDFDDLDVDLSLVSNKDEIAERLKGIMADAGYTVEITPAGINAEAPVGTFGDQDKAEDLVKGLIMKLYPDVREDQVAVFLNTDAAVEDQEEVSEDGEEHRDEVVVGAMVLVNGEWYAVDAVDHEVSTVVYASNKDGQEFEFTLDDIESVDTSSVEIFTDPPAEDAEETVTESYTSSYMAEQPVATTKKVVEPIIESVSFKERFKPKTIDQLAELRKYGL